MGQDQPTILLVEDDALLADLVSEYLIKNGMQVDIEPRGDNAVGRILDVQPDVVVLDLMLPGLDGLEVCRQVRPAFPGGILMLTARGEDIDEVVGLEVGADDYLKKPVKPRVLLARLHALLRRLNTLGAATAPASSSPPADGSRVSVGGLDIDQRSRAASMNGAPLNLTTAEFDLLFYLASHAGETLTREQIYQDVRGIAYDGLDRSIDLRVARIRKKLGDDAKQPELLKSVRGVGYLLAVHG